MTQQHKVQQFSDTRYKPSSNNNNFRHNCDSCRNDKTILLRSAFSIGPKAVPPIVHEVLREPGRPLDPATRAFMEPRFGHDFSNVRVHTGPLAAESAQAVNALAYTIGHNIVFGSGYYTPGNNLGNKLLAHELAHTIQQGRNGSSVNSDSSHEFHAQVAADAFAREQTSITVRGATGICLSCQRSPLMNPELPLNANELFDIIVRERAFTFSRGGKLVEDPQGKGRGVGPAAGGRAAGSSVFTVIQVTDSKGNLIVRSRGEYVQSLKKIFGTEHAEPRAMRALEPSLQAVGPKARGGTMLVVLDQLPCGPESKDCAANLRNFAQRNGLELDVRVPTRCADVTGPCKEVQPRTAAKGAQRLDLQEKPATQVRLKRVDSLYVPPAPVEGPHGMGGGSPQIVPSKKESSHLATSSSPTTARKPSAKSSTIGSRKSTSGEKGGMRTSRAVQISRGDIQVSFDRKNTRLQINSSGAWKTAGTIASGATVGLSIWSHLTAIDTAIERLMNAMTGGISPEIFKMMGIIKEKFPSAQSLWDQKFSNWHEDRDYEDAVNWLKENGMQALIEKGTMLETMGDKLHVIYYYIQNLRDLEYEFDNYYKQINPIWADVHNRVSILHEIAERVLKYVQYDTTQGIIWGMYETFYFAAKDLENLASLLSGRDHGYRAEYDVHKKRKSATKIFNFWAPAYQKVWPYKVTSTHEPEN